MAFAIFRVDSEIVKNELRKKISREKEIVRVSEQVFSGFEKKGKNCFFHNIDQFSQPPFQS